jgi:hypothetical protein
MYIGVYRFAQPCNLEQARTVCVATSDASIGMQHPRGFCEGAKDSNFAQTYTQERLPAGYLPGAIDALIVMRCNTAQLSERQLPKRLPCLGGSVTFGMSDERSQITIFGSIESSLLVTLTPAPPRLRLQMPPEPRFHNNLLTHHR